MNAASRCVTIESPARLHLGFVDLNGDLGRKFGSLGLAIDGLSTTVTAGPADALSVSGFETVRTRKYASDTLAALGLDERIAFDVSSAIPAHAGLGSGTQLALAVASAIARVHGLDHSVQDLAALTGRGLRSGIGIGVFESGGFVVDGGRSARTVVPPVLGRFAFPERWRVILVQDTAHEGLSGSAETAAFAEAEPMSPQLAETLCRATLMGVFPSLVEEDFATFAAAIARIQQIIGDYFGPWQGGPFTSVHVASAIEHLRDAYGLEGAGQTSWGPTGFAFAESAAHAEHVVARATERFADRPNLRFSVHTARNRGASIAHPAAARLRSDATV